MKTRKTPIQPIQVDLLCNKCESTMQNKSNDFTLAVYPPKYLHVCNKCGHTQLEQTAFPHIAYEPIGNAPEKLSETKNLLED